MKENVNILMTGAGAPGAAGILHCLQQAKYFSVIAADADANAVGKYLAKKFTVIPPASDPSFIDALVSVCVNNAIDVMMPLVTRELLPLAQHSVRFEEAGTRVLVSSAQSLSIANNKGALYDFLKNKNIAVPAYRIVDGSQPLALDNFKSAVHDLSAAGATVCFKPCVANGSRGFRILATNIDEQDLLFNRKPDNSFMQLEDALRVLGARPFPSLLVSEFLPGEEYSVDCLAQQGNSIVIVPRLRKKMRSGISVEGEFVHDEEIIHYCKEIIAAIGLHGNIGLQVKRKSNGEPLLLEINPRVQGTIVAGLGAGINLPVLAVKQAMGMPVDEKELQVQWGTRFSRFFTEVFHR